MGRSVGNKIKENLLKMYELQIEGERDEKGGRVRDRHTRMEIDI